MKLSPKAQIALACVIKQFQSGDLSPIVEIARLHRQGDPVPFDGWSFCNRIMAYIQTGSTDLRGYNQWRKVGRQVKKNSHAAFILAPRFEKKKDKATGEEKHIMAGFLSIAVFPYHDTVECEAFAGEPIPEHDYVPRELPPLADPVLACPWSFGPGTKGTGQCVAHRLGVDVTWQPLPPDRLGQWSAGRNEIDLATHDESTFFHELAHAAHTRIDGPKQRPGQDPNRETIADFTACVLMHLYGLGDRTGNTWRYIARYHADPLIAIQKALAKVERVLALLLDGTESATENETEETNVTP